MALCGRLGEKSRAQAPRLDGWDFLREEDPHVRAIARPRDLYVRRNVELSADVDEGRYVPTPLGLVEVECEETAGLFEQERIDADGVPTREVVAYHLVGDGKQRPVGTLGALDLRLAAQGAIPFVRARGCIA